MKMGWIAFILHFGQTILHFVENEDGLDALVYHKSSTIVLSWYYAYDERTQLTCEASYSETRVRNEGKSILNLPAYEVSP